MAADRRSTRPSPSERVEGSIERVTFHSDETGFCVLRVKVQGHRDPVTVVGLLPSVVAGEWVTAEGQWAVDREHGRQFKAETIRTTAPDSLEGIERFLGSGLIKGVGPVCAGRLVARFGLDVLDVIDRRSALLEKVEGIGRTRRLRIKQGWEETQAIRAIMAFLLSHGVGTARAFRIHKAYGEAAVERIKTDPYCLAREIRGIGFKTADQVAAKVGIEKTSPLRARAGVEHVLLEISGEGHCACARAALIAKAVEILDIPERIVSEAVDHGIENRRLAVESAGPPDTDLIYPAPLYRAEVGLARDLVALSRGDHPCPAFDTSRAVAWCQEKVGLTLAEAQVEALKTAFRAKAMVVTGGPGVGKTTLVNAIIRVFFAKGLRVVLCAPTGRAARRMSETTGQPAKTIHRLLAFDPGSGRFKHDSARPLEGDLFVVDEASMIDVKLAADLLSAIPSRAALIFVGDVDQLPSVGPGTVLRDVIDANVVPVCRLTHVFRQAARSDIITNAHRIHDGLMPATAEPGRDSDFFFVEAEDPDRALESIRKLVSRNIPRRFGFDPVRDVQVIAPMHRGTLGARNLNLTLQQLLNPEGESVERFGYAYRVNDKVMQTENDYDKDVFNGDMGRVTRIDREDHEVTVRFDDREVVYDTQELDELAPAYAVTVHKSQGSEFPCVVVPIHTQHYVMLQRNLLYTAVTRGRRLVVIIGSRKALAIAVKRVEAGRRVTRLRERLAAAGAAGLRPDP